MNIKFIFFILLYITQNSKCDSQWGKSIDDSDLISFIKYDEKKIRYKRDTNTSTLIKRNRLLVEDLIVEGSGGYETTIELFNYTTIGDTQSNLPTETTYENTIITETNTDLIKETSSSPDIISVQTTKNDISTEHNKITESTSTNIVSITTLEVTAIEISQQPTIFSSQYDITESTGGTIIMGTSTDADYTATKTSISQKTGSTSGATIFQKETTEQMTLGTNYTTKTSTDSDLITEKTTINDLSTVYATSLGTGTDLISDSTKTRISQQSTDGSTNYETTQKIMHSTIKSTIHDATEIYTIIYKETTSETIIDISTQGSSYLETLETTIARTSTNFNLITEKSTRKDSHSDYTTPIDSNIQVNTTLETASISISQQSTEPSIINISIESIKTSVNTELSTEKATKNDLFTEYTTIRNTNINIASDATSNTLETKTSIFQQTTENSTQYDNLKSTEPTTIEFTSVSTLTTEQQSTKSTSEATIFQKETTELMILESDFTTKTDLITKQSANSNSPTEYSPIIESISSNTVSDTTITNLELTKSTITHQSSKTSSLYDTKESTTSINQNILSTIETSQLKSTTELTTIRNESTTMVTTEKTPITLTTDNKATTERITSKTLESTTENKINTETNTLNDFSTEGTITLSLSQSTIFKIENISTTIESKISETSTLISTKANSNYTEELTPLNRDSTILTSQYTTTVAVNQTDLDTTSLIDLSTKNSVTHIDTTIASFSINSEYGTSSDRFTTLTTEASPTNIVSSTGKFTNIEISSKSIYNSSSIINTETILNSTRFSLNTDTSSSIDFTSETTTSSDRITDKTISLESIAGTEHTTIHFSSNPTTNQNEINTLTNAESTKLRTESIYSSNEHKTTQRGVDTTSLNQITQNYITIEKTSNSYSSSDSPIVTFTENIKLSTSIGNDISTNTTNHIFTTDNIKNISSFSYETTSQSQNITTMVSLDNLTTDKITVSNGDISSTPKINDYKTSANQQEITEISSQSQTGSQTNEKATQSKFPSTSLNTESMASVTSTNEINKSTKLSSTESTIIFKETNLTRETTTVLSTISDTVYSYTGTISFSTVASHTSTTINLSTVDSLEISTTKSGTGILTSPDLKSTLFPTDYSSKASLITETTYKSTSFQQINNESTTNKLSSATPEIYSGSTLQANSTINPITSESIQSTPNTIDDSTSDKTKQTTFLTRNGSTTNILNSDTTTDNFLPTTQTKSFASETIPASTLNNKVTTSLSVSNITFETTKPSTSTETSTIITNSIEIGSFKSTTLSDSTIKTNSQETGPVTTTPIVQSSHESTYHIESKISSTKTFSPSSFTSLESSSTISSMVSTLRTITLQTNVSPTYESTQITQITKTNTNTRSTQTDITSPDSTGSQLTSSEITFGKSDSSITSAAKDTTTIAIISVMPSNNISTASTLSSVSSSKTTGTDSFESTQSLTSPVTQQISEIKTQSTNTSSSTQIYITSNSNPLHSTTISNSAVSFQTTSGSSNNNAVSSTNDAISTFTSIRTETSPVPSTKITTIANVPTTTSLASTTTSTTSSSVSCLFNSDCSKIYGGSVCISNICSCLVPTYLYNGNCINSVSINLNLKVYVPIFDVCEYLFVTPVSYFNSFKRVIKYIAQTSQNLINIFVSTEVNDFKFTGDISYVYRPSVCPSRIGRSFNGLKRFVRSVDSTSLDFLKNSSYSNFTDQQIADEFNQLVDFCNNTYNLNYVPACWQTFAIDYKVYLKNVDLNNTTPSETEKKYTKIFLDTLDSFQQDNVYSIVLTEKSSNEHVYLNVNSLTEICNITNPKNSQDLNSCLNNTRLLESIKNSTYNQLLNTNQPSYSNLCNIYSKTCVFQNRYCIDSYYGAFCECQPGYVPINGYNSECTKPCSRKCLNNGRCLINNNQETCYCVNLFFGDSCQFNGLIILIVGAILMFLSALITVILWLCFFRRRKNKNEKAKKPNEPNEPNEKQNNNPEEEIMKTEHQETIPKENLMEYFLQNQPDTEDDPYDIDWDKFTNDDELNWDNIFGKLDKESYLDEGAINPAFLSKVPNLMIPRINPDGSKNLFGSSIRSSNISLPGPTDFNEFRGIPRAWYPNLNTLSDTNSRISYDDENQEENYSYF